MKLFSYSPFSKSGKDLAQALGIKRIAHKGSRFKGAGHKKVINWGASNLPANVANCDVINPAEAVLLASNKLKFFNALKIENVHLLQRDDPQQLLSYPEFTDDKEEAQGWLGDGRTVVERHKLTGNSGDGIVICTPDDVLGDAKLYTLYTPKKQEYRVHVMNGKVIDMQRKARVKAVPDEEVDWKVRNLAGGFIFARNEDHEVPDMVGAQALLAVEVCGLDFGAVDIIFNDKNQLAYVLEINTAPGLSGTTLDNYVDAFKNL